MPRLPAALAMHSLLCFLMLTALASAAPIDKGDRSTADAILEDESGAATDVDPVPAATAPEGFAEVTAARQALADGNIDLCHEKLRAAYAKSPNLPPPKLMLARMLLSARYFSQGRALLEEVALSHPNQPDVYLLFGKLALADGHATDAALHFEKAEAMDLPENWNDGQRKYHQRACREGKTLVAEQRGDWPQAVKLYQEQVDARPKDAALRDRFAMLLFRAGQQPRAFEQFDLSYLQDPSMNPPEVSMAVMYVQQADYEQADTWFAKALEKHNENASVFFEHSIALLYQDRTQEAADSAAKAVELGMSSPLLETHLGLIAMQQGDGAAAEKHFAKVLQDNPDNAGVITKLALVLVERGDEASQKRAVALAEQAGKAYPASPEVGAVLGWVYYRTGRKTDGGNLLRAATAQDQTNPLALFLLARMLVLEEETDDIRPVANLLSQRIEQPGLFVFRPAARKWLESLSLGETQP